MSAKSEKWIEQQLAVAIRNAKANRSIDVCMGSKEMEGNEASRDIEVKTQRTIMVSWPTEVDSNAYASKLQVRVPTSRGKLCEINKAEQKTTAPGFVDPHPTPSIYSVIDNWSNAVKSIFSEKVWTIQIEFGNQRSNMTE